MKFEAFFSYFSPITLIFGCFIAVFGSHLISFGFSITLPILLVLNGLLFLFLVFKRSKRVIIPTLGFIVYFICFDSFVQFHKKANNSDNSISILTYNIRGTQGNNVDYFDKEGRELIEFIKKKNPDVLVFQEFTKFGIRHFNFYPYRFLGYRYGKEKSLQFTLSKYPIIATGYVDFDNTRNNAMYADIVYKGEIIRIYNVHLESYKTDTMYQLNNPNSYSPLFKRISVAEKVRKAQALQVKAHIDTCKYKTIICGDFNSTPFSLSYSILREGRQDSFVEKGNGLGTTYWLFNYPFRLDYILPDEDFEVLSHQNFNLKLSDHEPVFSELRIKNE